MLQKPSPETPNIVFENLQDCDRFNVRNQCRCRCGIESNDLEIDAITYEPLKDKYSKFSLSNTINWPYISQHLISLRC
jgi:hypothetical protein